MYHICVCIIIYCILSFPRGSAGKESACYVGDLGSIPGLGTSPGEGNGNPLQYSCLEHPHGQKSLAGYSPWGYKESDMTEQLRTAQHDVQRVNTLPHGTPESDSVRKVLNFI